MSDPVPYSLAITLRTLTPIWTGGIEQSRDLAPRDSTMKAKESGIVGSMRFWARQLFGDGETNKLFGVTDEARSFRIRVSGLSEVEVDKYMPLLEKYAGAAYGRDYQGKKVLWGNKESGDFSLILDLRSSGIVEPKKTWDKLCGLLTFMARSAGLGAKTQHGFGQFSVPNDLPSLFGTASLSTVSPPSNFFSTIYETSGQPDGLRSTIKSALNTRLSTSGIDKRDLISLFGKLGWTPRVHISHPFKIAANGNSRIKCWCFIDFDPKTTTVNGNLSKEQLLAGVNNAFDACMQTAEGPAWTLVAP